MPGTFDVDHSNMKPGIYCPGEDKVGENCTIVTLDIRVTTPYKEEVLTVKELHTVEHILAVELESACKNSGLVRKIYWGPMGCQTGFYWLLAVSNADNIPDKICAVLQEACRKVLLSPIYVTPADDEHKCGNFHTLYSTSEEVSWVFRRIYEFCERVRLNKVYDSYSYLEN